MSEFGDLKKLRAVLDALDPPMVMIGRCRTCQHWRRVIDHLGDCQQVGVWIGGHVPNNFGCVNWEPKP